MTGQLTIVSKHLKSESRTNVMWKRLLRPIEIIMRTFNVSSNSFHLKHYLVLIMPLIRNILGHIGLNSDHREFFREIFHV